MWNQKDTKERNSDETKRTRRKITESRSYITKENAGQTNNSGTLFFDLSELFIECLNEVRSNLIGGVTFNG